MRLVQSYAANKTVLEAARERISWLFDLRAAGEISDIRVSISGGKDSTVLAWLVLSEAKRRGEKVGVLFLDEEVMYESTIQQVERIIAAFEEHIVLMWLQIPFQLTNATSVSDALLDCWEPGKHKLWMRPKREGAIKHKPWAPEKEKFRSGCARLDFYGVIENFERCYKNVVSLVGLRAAGESPNRWRAVTKNPVTLGGKRVYWGSQRGENFTAYPIFDWNFHDVWRFIHDEKVPYSKIYDMQFRKGYPINQMRVSSLIHEKSFKSICDLPEFEPKTYERLCKRIKGIQLAQETGKAAKLFACRKLPKNFKSWIAYRDFLLETHQDTVRAPIFRERFARQMKNEYVARQQVRQLVLNDYENNLPVDNAEDPRDALIRYYEEVL